jgi:hypothetical protein
VLVVADMRHTCICHNMCLPERIPQLRFIPNARLRVLSG